MYAWLKVLVLDLHRLLSLEEDFVDIDSDRIQMSFIANTNNDRVYLLGFDKVQADGSRDYELSLKVGPV